MWIHDTNHSLLRVFVDFLNYTKAYCRHYTWKYSLPDTVWLTKPHKERYWFAWHKHHLPDTRENSLPDIRSIICLTQGSIVCLTQVVSFAWYKGVSFVCGLKGSIVGAELWCWGQPILTGITKLGSTDKSQTTYTLGYNVVWWPAGLLTIVMQRWSNWYKHAPLGYKQYVWLGR